MVINAQGNTKKLNRCMIDESNPVGIQRQNSVDRMWNRNPLDGGKQDE